MAELQEMLYTITWQKHWELCIHTEADYFDGGGGGQ
jgi:hypothetical protein